VILFRQAIDPNKVMQSAVCALLRALNISREPPALPARARRKTTSDVILRLVEIEAKRALSLP
jgi:hypothetical protein